MKEQGFPVSSIFPPHEEVKKKSATSQTSEKGEKEPDIFPSDQEITVQCRHILPPLGDDLFRKISSGAFEKGPPFSSFRNNVFGNE